jgi:thiamine pyrophosphate-dependent acetolactate synthase large subunit-like protein
MSRHSTAHYFLEGLVDLGVDYIFANLGTDHVSLIEEMAREFTKILAADIARWGEVARAADIKIAQ